MKSINFSAFILCLIDLHGAAAQSNSHIETHQQNSPAIGKNQAPINYGNINVDHSCVIYGNMYLDSNKPQTYYCGTTTTPKAMNAFEEAQLAIILDENNTTVKIADARLGCWVGDNRTFINLTFSNLGKRTATVTKYGKIQKSQKQNYYPIVPYPTPKSGTIRQFVLHDQEIISLPYISLEDIRNALQLNQNEFIYAVSTENEYPPVPSEVKNCSAPFGEERVPNFFKRSANMQALVVSSDGTVTREDPGYSATRMSHAMAAAFEYVDIFNRKFVTVSQFNVFTVETANPTD